MSTIIVTNTSALTAALQSAKSGDVIKLAAGEYSRLSLEGVSFAGSGITVTSLDPSNMATLNGFWLKNCQGLHFSNLEMVADPATLNAYQIIGSSNISFDQVDVHGSLDGDAQNDASGLFIRNSDGVTVTNSEFHQLKGGVGHLDSKNIVIDGNKFYEIQTDGVLGGGTSNITVSNNVFKDFYPKGKDHPDAIQFWTTNTKASATDITVTGNVIVRGDGAPIQGIFFRDQVGDLPFKNVTISDNIVIGGGLNGIRLNGVEGVTISHNVVAGLPDQQSAITVSRGDGVTLTDNAATLFSIASTVTQVTDIGSKLIDTPKDGGAALLEAYFSTSDALDTSASLSFSMEAAASTLATMEAQRQDLQTVNGTEGADKLTVDAKRDTVINAGGGDDLLTSGGVGHNTLIGGAGNDSYRVNSAFDVVVEGAGEGTDNVLASVDFELGDNVEDLKLVGDAREGIGNELDNRITGSVGDNDLYGMDGDDVIQSGGGSDFASGGNGSDRMYGDDGADTLQGNGGSDQLRGDGGDDSISGGSGDDVVIGGGGADALGGGGGADTFQFGSGDISMGEVILDFNRLEGDKINLQPIDANTLLTRNQAFDFIGNGGFTKAAGQLRYEVSGSDAYVMGDVDGDGVADFQLLVKNVTSFSSSDFLL
ncbi:MAG: right-handed parallel beta-helix repeat-containing protein [Pseudomonadota bacterium]